MIYLTSIGTIGQIGDLTGHDEKGRTFPVGWVDGYVFDLDEKFVITDFWDRLFLYGNGFCLESSSVSAPMTRSKVAPLGPRRLSS